MKIEMELSFFLNISSFAFPKVCLSPSYLVYSVSVAVIFRTIRKTEITIIQQKQGKESTYEI